MGYDATNHLPKPISMKKLVDFLKLLEFEGKGNYYHFYKEDDYKYLYGVTLTIKYANDDVLVHTRTPIYCSPFDLKYQNYVIKQLKQYFGGYFTSDNGKNRYFKVEEQETIAPERGCYAAYFSLSNIFSEMQLMLNNYNEDQKQAEMLKIYGVTNGETLISNITTTYIASIIENFFRQMYIALLKYSENKESIITSTQVNRYDIFRVSENEISIEEAVTLSKSFQNIQKINEHFLKIDKKIDIKGALSKPYNNRKENLYSTMNRILEHRHSLVHKMDVNKDYGKDCVIKDIQSVETALQRAYKHICDVYSWKYT